MEEENDMDQAHGSARGTSKPWKKHEDRCHLRFTARTNKPFILERSEYETYRGHIREGAEECYVSFPGRYVSGWDALTSERQNYSVACLFLCTPEDGLGQHYREEASGPCLCHTIYGERSFFSYLLVLPGTLTDDEVTRRREIAKHVKAVVIREDATPEARQLAEEEARKTWNENGRVASWGCQGFQDWKENVEEAVKLKQRLKVFFFPGQVGQGKVAWEDLRHELDLWDDIGCEGDQKCEIAYLDKMWKEKGDDWAYDSVDVTDFLKDEFKVGGDVDAFDGQQWWNGTLLGVPKTVPKDPRDAKWVVQSQAGEIFTTDRVRHADSMRQMLADVGQEEFLGFVKSALPAGLQVSKTLEFIFPNGTPSLAMRLDIKSIAVFQVVRNTVLSTDLEMIVNKKLEMHSKSKWQVRLDKTHFCEVFEKELLSFTEMTQHHENIEEEELERLQKLSLERQKQGVAPLPVVRLCFVGRGRAGKTTTLRRLKGESFRDDEPSTHGLDVWAGQVEADLQADLKKTHPWKRWEESMHLTALKDGLRNPLPKGPETDALTAQNADEQPDDMLEPQGLIEPEAGSKDDEQAQSTQGLNEPEHATSVASHGPKANQPDALLESSAAAQPTQGLNKPEEHATSVASQGPEANQPDALLESSAAAQPTQGLDKPEEHATSVASQGPNANEQPQEDISSSSGPKMCGPVVLDEDMLSKLGSHKAGIDVRLQCWDFPGQEEYALLNQLHFSERAIYLVFLDLTGQLEDEWRHLSFWLWKIVRFSTEKDACPPILLIGTKAGARNRCVTDLDLQKRLEDLQSRVPRLKEQLQPHPADLGSKCTKCPWLFPIENKGKKFEAWISPLRMQLQRMALQFVSPRDLWEAGNSDGSVVPRFVGLQAETFPLTWLQAHDLLTRLGAGFRARAERAHIEKVYPGAQPGSRLKIEDYLRATISDKVWLNLPPGAFIELHSQDQLDDLREEELSFDVSCDFLELKVVQRLLGGMEPKGLSLEDTEKLLDMLNKLGILVWINEDKLRDTVMLNPRQVAVAMANLITLCFSADNFEHKNSAIEVIRKIPDSSASDLLRFRSSGIATQDVIKGVWKKDFDEASQQLLQEVLLRNDLMCGRLVQDEFVLPSCLPVAHCAEEAIRETDEVLYLDVGGLLSPNFFPALAHLIYRNINLESLSMCKKPGPPQVFRNRGDLHSDTHSVFVSLFPVSAPNDKSLLRILVRGNDQKANCALAQEVKRVLLNDILGFDPETEIDVEKDPSSFFGFKGAKDKETLELERSFALQPCLNSQCNLTCSLCRLSALLQERFLPDLSLGLRSIVETTAFQRHTRPAGSFRFKSMQFPGDVDLEEYLVIDAKCKDDALPKLCSAIQEIFAALFARNSEVQVFIGGLKAGSNPRQNVPGVQKEWLKWSQKELCAGKKEMCRDANAAPVFMTLSKALEEGHETWTAKIDMFAKVRLFHDSEATPRFFEITNVLRAGYFEGSKPIQPITKEKDSLQGIEMNLKNYSSEEPNAMKYVKRLWERSAYLAQRGFDLDWHVNMLEALRPLLSHWSAELCQIAAHVETLIKMMKFGRGEVIEHALDDLRTVRQSLLSLQSRLHSVEDSEQPAAQDGLERIRDAMKYILKKPIIDPETKKPCSRGLHKAQLLLESCVETVVISKLGSFEFPVAKRLGELWQFPSDHPPIAAKLTLGERTIKVASWNVLNRNYYKYIDADTQGLKGSQITTLHEAERRESTIVEKIQEMLLKTNIHILCLEECWPELIAELKAALGENLLFEMLCSGDEQDKNQEVIVFDSKLRVMYVHHHPPFSENSKKVVTEVHFQLETESLRVVTTHVPGAPFGRARREFADCLAEIVKGEKLPTVLMADLNFPDKAVHPLLLDRGLEDIYFVPTPYPTNICQGSLLPKRIDSIAAINHQVAGSKLYATAMGAKELLDGLDKVVELLQSKSAEPLTPTRYHSDKVETDAEQISRLERELHAARQRVKYLQSTIDCQNEERAREAPATSSKERAREALLPHRPTDAPSGHYRRNVQVSSVHRVEPEKL